jgi:protein-S-isoprenylcysteine O-methyltransferase Ste14
VFADPMTWVTELWFAIFVVWFLTGVVSKQTLRFEADTASRIAVRIVAIAWVLLLYRGFTGLLGEAILPASPTVMAIGEALTVVGLGFAVWARFHIGRNWDALVALKQDHQLVRSGPYGIVRHPIYSGFMFASLGTALVERRVHAFLAVALIVGAWSYKAKIEERLMEEQFGAAYDEYRKAVKGLVPFVW